MNAIAVEGGGYDTAVEAFVGGNHGTALAYDVLTHALDGCASMAGDDATSTDFGRAYDTAARDALAAHHDLADAFTTLARLTARSAANHRDADLASVVLRPAPAHDGRLGERPVDLAPHVPPSCVGGDTDAPELWNLVVDHLQGFAWPNADTATLRAAARAWSAAGADLRVLPGSCETASTLLGHQRSPEIPLALAAVDELERTIGELAASYDDLGRACTDYAAEVERHRDVIRGILRDLAVEAGISAAAGAITGLFSFGAGALAGTALAATRGVVAARRILVALRALQAAAQVRAWRVAAAAQRIRPVRATLTRFRAAGHADDAAAVRHADDLDDLDDTAALARSDDWRSLPRKIEYTWDEPVDYNTGATLPIDHIRERHWPDSTVHAKGRFSPGITEEQVRDYVDRVSRHWDPGDDPGSFRYDIGVVIGRDRTGEPTTFLQVHIRDGVVHNAYPADPPEKSLRP